MTPDPPTPAPSAATGDAVEVAPGVLVPREALRFSFSSSGGPGGQNVNKRATKAELRIDPLRLALPPDAQARLRGLAGRRLTDEGEIVLTSDEHRSQARNRAACLDRLRDLVVRALVRPRTRRRTRPTRGSVERRLREKKAHTERKSRRARPEH